MALQFELLHSDGTRESLRWEDPLIQRVLAESEVDGPQLRVLEDWVHDRLAERSLEAVPADRPGIRAALIGWLERKSAGTVPEIRVHERTAGPVPTASGQTRPEHLHAALEGGAPLWVVYDNPVAAAVFLRQSAERSGYGFRLWDLYHGWTPALGGPNDGEDPIAVGLRQALSFQPDGKVLLTIADPPISRDWLDMHPSGVMMADLIRRQEDRPHLRVAILRPDAEIPPRWRGLFQLIRLNTSMTGTPVLDALGEDLTEKARSGRLEEVVGREEELEAMLDILSRAPGLPNSPLLVGRPGVGKTAIIEALALRVARGEVPTRFRNRRVIALNVTALAADGRTVGGLEHQLRALTAELERSGHSLIVFVDEIHTLLQIGGEGAPAAQALKGSLGRGTISIVGATTDTEAVQVERDPAFARRFKRVVVAEPTQDQTLVIATRWRDKLERHHRLSISGDIVRLAVTEADWHLLDQYRPYSAISLLGDAAARAERRGRPAVLADDIYESLKQAVGLEVRLPDEQERARLDEIEALLRRQILGQEAAITQVMRFIRGRRFFATRTPQPFRMLFTGPSGCGKTALAELVGKLLFPGVEPVVYAMESYTLEHQATDLIGAPPSFVGFEQGSRLVNDIRTRPRTVIVVDEVEKAHPRVLQSLMGVLDRGQFKDPRGIVGDFRHAYFLLTSNVVSGATDLSLPADQFERLVTDRFVDLGFRPEQVGRFGPKVRFSPLGAETQRQIAGLRLTELAADVNEAYGITLSWEEDVPAALAAMAHDPLLGARPIRDQVVFLQGEIAALLADPQRPTEIVLQVDPQRDALRLRIPCV